MQLRIDPELLEDGAAAWWRSLTPAERAVQLDRAPASRSAHHEGSHLL